MMNVLSRNFILRSRFFIHGILLFFSFHAFADDPLPMHLMGCSPVATPNKMAFIAACVQTCSGMDPAWCNGIYNSYALQQNPPCSGGYEVADACQRNPPVSPTVSAIPVPPSANPKSIAPPSATPAAATPTPRRRPSASKPTGNPAQDGPSCTQLMGDAIRCCNDPTQCTDSSGSLGGFNQGTGINKACKNMNGAGNAAGNTNVDAGGACYRAYSACMDMCHSAGNSDAEDQCNRLQYKAQTYGANGQNGYNAANQGQNCNDSTGAGGLPGMTPQSTDSNGNPITAQDPKDPLGCATNPSNPACANCALNPSGCNQAPKQDPPQKGKVAFQDAAKPSGGANSFNAPDIPSFQPTFAGAGNTDPNAQQRPEGHTIPNGGGPMAGGDQNTKPASLGNENQRGGGSPGAPGYTTQIEGGMLAGGYSQQGGPGDTSMTYASLNNRGAFNGGRGPASAGMDLKKYLPGQPRSPYHNFVGGNGHLMAPDLYGPSANMFDKHTARIMEKCKLGLLRDCR